MKKTRDNIALITGASRGLGSAISHELALKKFHTILAARTIGSLEEVYDRIIGVGGTASVLPLDIMDEESIKKSCLTIYDRWKKIDLWVHTAINAPALSPVEHIDAKDLKHSIEINVISTSRLITNLKPLLKNSKKSKAIFFYDPVINKKYHTSYGISKTAQLYLVSKWKEENSVQTLDILIETPNPMATTTRAKFYPGEDVTKLCALKKQAREIVTRILK